MALKRRRCRLNANATWRSRHTWGGQRWRPGDEPGQPAQVLGNRRQRELELGPARPAQSQASEPEDTLEMCKQHLNTFAVMTRLFECRGLGMSPGNVPSLLVDAARDPAERRLWAALRFQWAAAAVTHAGHVKKCLSIVDLRCSVSMGTIIPTINAKLRRTSEGVRRM